ncbi:phospholipid carrier-dependent glycosyltransferase [Erythrobacter sp. SCSIO 43205]|uniref:phospholipid carrier-dependent glycosyltransferase n=1 Tax=Erythrobacter sp. SCSIO 43205 TaxID=2779361 RepID=UPI001CAA3EA5|nr:phospholipid carrier-dependent glycosyltransferase [Erythrobacter sp. SCSIO 43205]UAB77507.1 phospholipid carrier-dependent glycosyltransferase [Erythrobacter sp. SCSIO 43205]
MNSAALPELKPSHTPPTLPAAHDSDPWGWCLIIPLIFAALASVRLGTPSSPFFDEIHYLPAARDMLAALAGAEVPYANPEHPLLGKALIAAGIGIAGDNPFGWRIMSLIAGTIAVGASMRALWFASEDRFACVSFGVLLVTGFHLFVQSRIAMLDIFMVAFLAIAAWQFAGAINQPETGRRRLILTGIAIGCALGSKWNAVPMAALPGIVFFAARLTAGRRRLLLSRRGAPVPGITLVEAFVWLGILPLVTYAATFAPGYWLGNTFHPSPLLEHGLLGLHAQIIEMQQQVLSPHTYQSRWEQWASNTRGIWYLYENIDGAQRGVLLIGNPVTMIAGLAGLIWCGVVGILHSDWARRGVVIGYLVALGFWIIAPKPVQFYYHYVTPSLFLLAALALSLSDLREAGSSKLSYAVLAASVAIFAVFFPILTAAPLEGERSFEFWMWLDGWR